jgi:hypothetical protein
MTGIRQAAYLVGFGLFIIAIYLAFTGLLSRFYWALVEKHNERHKMKGLYIDGLREQVRPE